MKLLRERVELLTNPTWSNQETAKGSASLRRSYLPQKAPHQSRDSVNWRQYFLWRKTQFCQRTVSIFCSLRLAHETWHNFTGKNLRGTEASHVHGCWSIFHREKNSRWWLTRHQKLLPRLHQEYTPTCVSVMKRHKQCLWKLQNSDNQHLRWFTEMTSNLNL